MKKIKNIITFGLLGVAMGYWYFLLVIGLIVLMPFVILGLLVDRQLPIHLHLLGLEQ
jgi:hypothetical protein